MVGGVAASLAFGNFAHATTNALEVRGTATCPTPTLVAESLRPLLSVDADLPSDAWLEVISTGPSQNGEPETIDLRLVRAGDAAPLAVRHMGAFASCAEAAQAAAVVAATWVAHVRSPPPPVLRLSLPVASAPVEVRMQAAPAPPPTRFVWSIDAGAGLVASPNAAAAPYGVVGLEARQPASPWGVRLAVAGFGERTFVLEPGLAAWRRLNGSAGAFASARLGRAFADAGLGLVGGAAFFEGRGFTSSRTSWAFDIGATPWVRAGAQLGTWPVAFWVGGGALLWAREQKVQVDGIAERPALPRVDLMLGGGVAWMPWSSPPRPVVP